jgi:hypothetical protein
MACPVVIGWRGLSCIEPPRLDLADVSDKVGFDASVLLQEFRQAAEQLII